MKGKENWFELARSEVRVSEGSSYRKSTALVISNIFEMKFSHGLFLLFQTDFLQYFYSGAMSKLEGSGSSRV